VSGFVWSQFRYRRRRILVLGLAILAAAVSFVLLTSAAKSSSLRVRGTLSSNFRPAYDILVRPKGSKSSLERQRGLVPPNYLSGTFGGITLGQWRKILKLRGVEVAAPVANLGYVLALAVPQIPLNRYLNTDRRQILQVRSSWVAYNGRVHYPGDSPYVYVTRSAAEPSSSFGLEELLPHGRTAYPCEGFYTAARTGSGDVSSPFTPARGLTCYSTRSPDADGAADSTDWQGHGVGAVVTAYFPLLLSAIDPEQEARLVGLPRTVVAGRYLRELEDAHYDQRCLVCNTIIPVIVADKTYVDEPLQLDVDRLQLPPASKLVAALSAASAPAFLARLPKKHVARVRVSSDAIWSRAREAWAPAASFNLGRGADISAYWSVGGVHYRQLSANRLRAETVVNPSGVWRNSNYSNGWFPAPPGSQETPFRRLHVHDDNTTRCGPLTAHLQAVGRFDQTRLPGFSPLSRVPLETYSPPQALPATPASRQALNGKPLGPTINLGDYIAQPPFMLTSLSAAERLLGRWQTTPQCKLKQPPSIFKHTTLAAPISAIRVRVAGVTGPDALSLTRIRVTAQKIHDVTGLDVDITAGSSPRNLLVVLPRGQAGRPALTVKEGWSQKGVAVSFVNALDRKDLLLFALVLLICVFFLGNAALASVRARRAEIGVLRTLGWPTRSVFGTILSEVALAGLAAGLVGTGLAVLIAAALSLEIEFWRTAFVLPISVLLALSAGAIPALLASRGEPLDAIRPSVNRRRFGAVKTMTGLALVNLRRLPGRTLLAASGLFIGAAALTVLIAIERSFDGTLVGTLLGNAISVQIRGADFVAVGLTVGLSGFAVADVLYLNLRERAGEFASLRAIGWDDRTLGRLILVEGITIGAIGSISGAATGVVIASLAMGVPFASLLIAGLIAASGGITVAAVGSVLPAVRAMRQTPARELAAE
jgi:ABC-type lipoprotein release transport system permease subunit